MLVNSEVARFPLPAVNQEDMKLEPVGAEGLPGRTSRWLHDDPDLLGEFANQGISDRLTFFDVAAGQVPHIRKAHSIRVAVTQEGLPIPTE